MTSIQELVDLELGKKEERIRSGKFSPSLLGSCYRRQWWNRANEPQTNPPDERSKRIFACGNLFHDFVQSVITKNNKDIEIEKLVETEDFKGFADIVNGEEVIDLKSQHSKSFWYMQGKTKEEIGKEKFNNFMQCAFYAVNLKKPLIRLVFISKDDLCIQEYPDEVYPYWAGLLDEEITKLQWYWKGKTLPPAEPRLYPQKDGTYRECTYCAFLDKCKGEEK